MAELSEATVAKFIDMMAGFQSELQALKTTQQSNTDQISAQVAKQIEQTIGSLQSDFSSRTSTIVNDADSVKSDERMRAQAADSNSAWAFKTNVYDFGQAKELLTASQQLSLHQANLNAATIKLVNGAVDKFLYDGQSASHLNDRYNNAKWQQELRHSDIASENQWEDKVELAGDIAGLETAKSTQVPPAATEHTS